MLCTQEPTKSFKSLWEGTDVTEYSENGLFNRFTCKLDKNTCLKTHVFFHLGNMRNMFTKRVHKTVISYLRTEWFGLGSISREEKLDALVDLVTHGLNRCYGGGDIITLPIFHVFSIESEVNSKIKARQRDLFAQLIKDSEYAKLNGKKVEDVLLSSEVAMIITIIRNNMVRIYQRKYFC